VALQRLEKTPEIVPQPEGAKRLPVRFEGLDEEPRNGSCDRDRCHEEESPSRPVIEAAASQGISDREESGYQSRDRSLRQYAEADGHPGEAGRPDVMCPAQDIEEEKDCCKREEEKRRVCQKESAAENSEQGRRKH